MSVESDRVYHAALVAHISKNISSANYTLVHANIGRTGTYGSPAFVVSKHKVMSKGLCYLLSGYSHFVEDKPDLIMVDGRWRVACCLFALLHGFSGSEILIDDYESNREYHKEIEQFFSVELTGRLARLTPKQQYDTHALTQSYIASLADPS